MMLLSLLIIPGVGSILAALWQRKASQLSTVSLVSVLGLTIYAYFRGESLSGLEDFWLLEYQYGWLHLALDGLSLTLILTSELLALLALTLCHPKEQFFLLSTLAGLIGLLLSIDLLAFFVFWELMLMPIYFWLLAYGKERKNFTALQFIIFTQASGLLLLGSIIALFSYTGSLNLNELNLIALPKNVEFLLACGFTFAFLIKLPAFPLHVWMPSLFREAPIPAILSGLLLKTGAYGILRFVLPIFPESVLRLAPFMIFLGAITVIYGAVLAFSQKNPRKVLAFSTLSHAGLMLMALFSNNLFASTGVIVLMITQALTTAGLFIALETHFGLSLFFVMATLGLPGLGNFIGELMVLFGLFEQHPWAAIVGASGLVLGAAYMLRLVVQINYGTSRSNHLNQVSVYACSAIVMLLIWMGLFPAPVLDLIVPNLPEDTSQPLLETPQEETL